MSNDSNLLTQSAGMLAGDLFIECLVSEGRQAAAELLASMAAILESEGCVDLAQVFPLQANHLQDTKTLLFNFRRLFRQDPSGGKLRALIQSNENARSMAMAQNELAGKILQGGLKDGTVKVVASMDDIRRAIEEGRK